MITAAKSPLVTIGLATYNRYAYVRQAVQSVLSQDYPHFEVIICDDCSTDGTWEYLQTITDSRVRLYRNTVNLGASANHQQIFHYARGEYMQFLQNDDKLMSTALSSTVPYLQQFPEAVGVVGGFAYIDRYSRIIGHSPAVDNPLLVRGSDLLHRMPMYTNEFGSQTNILIRKATLDAVGGFDTQIKFAYDLDLWVRLSFAGDWVFLPYVLYHRRVALSGSISFSMQHWRNRVCMIREILAVIDSTEDENAGLNRTELNLWKMREGGNYLMESIIYFWRTKDPVFLNLIVWTYGQSQLLSAALWQLLCRRLPYQIIALLYKRISRRFWNIRSGRRSDISGMVISKGGHQ